MSEAIVENGLEAIETDNNEIADPTSEALYSLLELIDNPQDFLSSLLLPPSSPAAKDQDGPSQVDLLRTISKELFLRVEKLAVLHDKIDSGNIDEKEEKEEEEEEEEESYPLSGLPELYTGSKGGGVEDDEDIGHDVDSETIFNQVDIQNTALLSKVKKTVRKLGKKIDKQGQHDQEFVRLLNMEDINSDEEKDTQNTYDSDEREMQNNQFGSEGDSEDEESEDEESRRIRERMERSMAEMDNSTDEEESSNFDEKVDRNREETPSKSEDLIDPSREELYDGFFDLHEMENFADEEEEMLPDEAFGGPEPDNEQSLEDRKKSLPHIRGREGREDDDDDYEDDEEFNALEKQVDTSVRRRRYREEEDIKALTGMYGDNNQDFDDEEEDEEDDVINMTAADYFGPPKKPSKMFLKKSKEEKEKKKVTFEDDDSWNDHDFSSEGQDWRDQDTDAEKTDGLQNEVEQNNDESDEDNDEEVTDAKDEDPKKLSSYGQKSKKLELMTEEFEKDLLAEKPWQMTGEAKGTQRPTNSLLEVTPTFEFATKMAPMITVEHTLSIEDMIKNRILAEDWDDVVPRELPDIGLAKRKGELPEVSQEKSKLSLGELYEREYLKKTTGYDADAVEKETEEEKAKNEMKMLFANLCSKLDALSNYHFAPRPVADEAEVKTSATPAVAMEEVLPLHVSDAQAMAPEEIFGSKKGRDSILRGESEMDQVSCISQRLQMNRSLWCSSMNFAFAHVSFFSVLLLLCAERSKEIAPIQEGSP